MCKAFGHVVLLEELQSDRQEEALCLVMKPRAV